MNRLEKELRQRGIVFDTDDMQVCLHGMEYDNLQHLVFFTQDFIVCRFDSAVLDSEFRLYDKRFNLIGTQNVWKDSMFGWESYCNYEQ